MHRSFFSDRCICIDCIVLDPALKGGGYIPRYITSTIHRHCTPNNHASHTRCVSLSEAVTLKCGLRYFCAGSGLYREVTGRIFPTGRGFPHTGRLPVKPGGLTPMIIKGGNARPCVLNTQRKKIPTQPCLCYAKVNCKSVYNSRNLLIIILYCGNLCTR